MDNLYILFYFPGASPTIRFCALSLNKLNMTKVGYSRIWSHNIFNIKYLVKFVALAKRLLDHRNPSNIVGWIDI